MGEMGRVEWGGVRWDRVGWVEAIMSVCTTNMGMHFEKHPFVKCWVLMRLIIPKELRRNFCYCWYWVSLKKYGAILGMHLIILNKSNFASCNLGKDFGKCTFSYHNNQAKTPKAARLLVSAYFFMGHPFLDVKYFKIWTLPRMLITIRRAIGPFGRIQFRWL